MTGSQYTYVQGNCNERWGKPHRVVFYVFDGVTILYAVNVYLKRRDR